MALMIVAAWLAWNITLADDERDAWLHALRNGWI